MFGDRSRQLSDMFAAQFTPHGSGFLYRRDHVGAGYAVTAAERDAFVAAYGREWRWTLWGAVAACFVLAGVAIVAFDRPGPALVFAATLVLGALPAWRHRRSWRRPERALARRLPSRPALDRRAARREKLSRITWGNLALGPVFAAVLAARAWRDEGGVHGWAALWIVAGAALLAMSAVQAWRKWRAERLN